MKMKQYCNNVAIATICNCNCNKKIQSKMNCQLLEQTLDFCDLNVIMCMFERKIINVSTYNRELSIMWCFVQQSGDDDDDRAIMLSDESHDIW